MVGNGRGGDLESDPAGHARLDDRRYCERCGFDFEACQPFALARALVLLLTADPGRPPRPPCPAPPAVAPTCFVVDRSATPMAIGRGREAPIPIPWDPAVSRRHAEIVWIGGGWGIREAQATNPTRVQGRALERDDRAPLEPGDVIELGCYARLEIKRLAGGGGESAP